MNKPCAECGADIPWLTGTRREDWSRRRYCGKMCKRVVDDRKRSNAPRPTPRTPDVTATKQLAKLCLRMYERVAQERGLPDKWHAAVQLGMRA